MNTCGKCDPTREVVLRHRISPLTPRQQEIASFLSRTGFSYKQVADKLKISVGTMRKHVENVYRKFGVHSRAELMVAMMDADGVTPLCAATKVSA